MRPYRRVRAVRASPLGRPLRASLGSIRPVSLHQQADAVRRSPCADLQITLPNVAARVILTTAPTVNHSVRNCSLSRLVGVVAKAVPRSLLSYLCLVGRVGLTTLRSEVYISPVGYFFDTNLKSIDNAFEGVEFFRVSWFKGSARIVLWRLALLPAIEA